MIDEKQCEILECLYYRYSEGLRGEELRVRVQNDFRFKMSMTTYVRKRNELLERGAIVKELPLGEKGNPTLYKITDIGKSLYLEYLKAHGELLRATETFFFDFGSPSETRLSLDYVAHPSVEQGVRAAHLLALRRQLVQLAPYTEELVRGIFESLREINGKEKDIDAKLTLKFKIPKAEKEEVVRFHEILTRLLKDMKRIMERWHCEFQAQIAWIDETTKVDEIINDPNKLENLCASLLVWLTTADDYICPFEAALLGWDSVGLLPYSLSKWALIPEKEKEKAKRVGIKFLQEKTRTPLDEMFPKMFPAIVPAIKFLFSPDLFCKFSKKGQTCDFSKSRVISELKELYANEDVRKWLSRMILYGAFRDIPWKCLEKVGIILTHEEPPKTWGRPVSSLREDQILSEMPREKGYVLMIPWEFFEDISSQEAEWKFSKFRRRNVLLTPDGNYVLAPDENYVLFYGNSESYAELELALLLRPKLHFFVRNDDLNGLLEDLKPDHLSDGYWFAIWAILRTELKEDLPAELRGKQVYFPWDLPEGKEIPEEKSKYLYEIFDEVFLVYKDLRSKNAKIKEKAFATYDFGSLVKQIYVRLKGYEGEGYSKVNAWEKTFKWVMSLTQRQLLPGLFS